MTVTQFATCVGDHHDHRLARDRLRTGIVGVVLSLACELELVATPARATVRCRVTIGHVGPTIAPGSHAMTGLGISSVTHALVLIVDSYVLGSAALATTVNISGVRPAAGRLAAVPIPRRMVHLLTIEWRVRAATAHVAASAAAAAATAAATAAAATAAATVAAAAAATADGTVAATTALIAEPIVDHPCRAAFSSIPRPELAGGLRPIGWGRRGNVRAFGCGGSTAARSGPSGRTCSSSRSGPSCGESASG